MAASGRVVTVQDIVEQTGGMILPNQVNRINDSASAAVNSGWSTSLILESAGTSYGKWYYPKGYFRVIPARAMWESYHLLSGLFSGGLKTSSYQNVAWSAKVDSYVYSVFPIRKNIRLRVYEDMAGTANFEYFYLEYDGTSFVSKTWSHIKDSWVGELSVPLYKTYTEKVLTMTFGGMNTKRHIYYSDNIVSPGSWVYLGKYNGVRSTSPGNGFADKIWVYSGVTRQKYGTGTGFPDTAQYPMSCIEYLYRLKDISIGVAYSSTPSSSKASSGNYNSTWEYPRTCAYSCSCDCNYVCSCDIDSSCNPYTS